MSRIRSRDTAPELRLRKALRDADLRYRLRLTLPGSPDLGFRKSRVAVFVDGCFWHGCPLHYSAPSTRVEFWAKKLRTNILRDAAADADLRALGWAPFHIWQHELRDIPASLARIRAALTSPAQQPREADVAGRVTGAEILRAAEPTLAYSAAPRDPWWRCACGVVDTQVIAVSGPGSLKPKAVRRPESATLRCRGCGGFFEAMIPPAKTP